MDVLTITNIVLACGVAFHLLCEFGHYIYSFYASRRDGNTLKEIRKCLEELKVLRQNCPHRHEDEPDK